MEGISFLDVIQLLGGIGIFLYAIRMISDSLQLLAGDSLQNLIGMLTKTPVLGVAMGALVTVLIQSSSATTVMTVSFVDAGLMTLNQAIGVIMGANIGTTITGQIIAFKIKDYVYLFIIIGVLLNMFGSTNRQKYFGSGLLGFGLLFIGMQTMEGSMAVLRSRSDLFLAFSENPFMGLLAGTLLTLVVQSSSATVGLTIVLGTQGLLPLEAAIPIVLGDNIGTTITAILASLGTKRVAKQACLAHVLFNVIGVCIFFPLIPLYTGLIESSASTIGHQIANAHSFFNIINTIVFLPFVSVFAKVIIKIIPDNPKDKNRSITFLDEKLIPLSPTIAVESVKNECVYMGSVLLETIDTVEELVFKNNTSLELKRELLTNEDKLDDIYSSLQSFSQKILRAGVTDREVGRLHSYLNYASDMERIGDKCKLLMTLEENKKGKQSISQEAYDRLYEIFKEASGCVEVVVQNIPLPLERAEEMRPIFERHFDAVRYMEEDIRAWHLERLSTGECNSMTGLTYVDSISAIERMAYRAKKIGQATVRKK